jgi:hypothetical protein
MKRTICIAMALVATVAAADRKAGDLGKLDLGRAAAARAPAPQDSVTITPTVQRAVVAREVTIFPGTTGFFDFPNDLSGCQQIGISVTSLSDPQSVLSNIRIGVAWAAPGDWYVITDVILGSDFVYTDHGGATVPVYGPFMRLVVTNDGASAVRITQLAGYAVAH